jgi:hypothetical protein
MAANAVFMLDIFIHFEQPGLSEVGQGERFVI